MENEYVTHSFESTAEGSNVELVQKILDHPDLQHPSRGARIRDTLAYFWKVYQESPNRRISLADLEQEVFGGPLEPEDSQARSAVRRSREWLEKYFESECRGVLRVTILPRRYGLHFYRVEPHVTRRPTEWFWNHHLNSKDQAAFALAKCSWGTPNFRSEDPDFVHSQEIERILRLYRAYAALLGDAPGILPSTWNEAPLRTLEGKAILSVGVVPADNMPYAELWTSWKGEKPMLMLKDSNGSVLLSDPGLSSERSRIHLETYGRWYVLVTQVRFAPPKVLTTIVGSDYDSIERVLEVLTSDALLSEIVTNSDLGGANLEQDGPEAFQIVFELSEGEDFDVQDDDDFEDSYPLRWGDDIRCRVIRRLERKNFHHLV